MFITAVFRQEEEQRRRTGGLGKENQPSLANMQKAQKTPPPAVLKLSACSKIKGGPLGQPVTFAKKQDNFKWPTNAALKMWPERNVSASDMTGRIEALECDCRTLRELYDCCEKDFNLVKLDVADVAVKACRYLALLNSCREAYSFMVHTFDLKMISARVAFWDMFDLGAKKDLAARHVKLDIDSTSISKEISAMCNLDLLDTEKFLPGKNAIYAALREDVELATWLEDYMGWAILDHALDVNTVPVLSPY
jgi:hypothetical protein